MNIVAKAFSLPISELKKDLSCDYEDEKDIRWMYIQKHFSSFVLLPGFNSLYYYKNKSKIPDDYTSIIRTLNENKVISTADYHVT